jgi:hypothetical protein
MNPKGDFTAQGRLLWIALLAVAIGALCAAVAQLLLWLIDLFTNLFYCQQFSAVHNIPAGAVGRLAHAQAS